MGCSIPACAECTQSCLVIHGKAWDTSSIVTSFFKVMMSDDDISEVMTLPPAFGRLVPNLKEEKTELEDSSGKKWTVTLAQSNGLWAFRQGWRAFSVDHGIEMGDLVIFHYIKGRGHCSVQIYGRHGFEKHKYIKGNGKRQRKRARSSSNFTEENGEKPPSTSSGSRKKQASGNSALSGSNIEPIRSEPRAADKISNRSGGDGREAQVLEPLRNEELLHTVNVAKDFEWEAQVQEIRRSSSGGDGGEAQVREPLCKEELTYMINRDNGFEHEDRRISLYDLSNFETPRSKDSGGDRVLGKKVSSFIGGVGPRSQAMTEDVPKLVEKECFTGSTSSRDPTSDSTSSQEKTKKKFSNRGRPPKPVKVATPVLQSNPSARWKFAAVPRPRALEETFKTSKYGFDGKMKAVKQEQVEINGEAFRPPKSINGNRPIIKEGKQSREPDIKDRVYAFKAVKPEPIDMEEEELPSHDVVAKDDIQAFNWSVTLVVASRSYLVSNVRFSAHARGRPRVVQVVILRDPASRRWPVLYYEKLGRKVLKGGWSGFCEANRIQEGDECSFKLEERGKCCVYRVIIIRKKLSSSVL